LGAGNEKLYLLGPDGVVNAGSGVDTVEFLGVNQGSAQITQQGSTVTVWSDWSSTGDGVTTLNGVDRIEFSDGSIALDTGATQNAGEVFRLYEAAFDRAADQSGMGYWLNAIDNGTSLLSIANAFVASSEFSSLYGANPSNSAYVNALYQNVLGRAPDASGDAFWVNALNSGVSKAQVLVDFAQSAEEVAHIAPVIATGIHYQAWVQ
jgi:hypothetical protein